MREFTRVMGAIADEKET